MVMISLNEVDGVCITAGTEVGNHQTYTPTNSQEVGSVVALEYTQRGKQVSLELSSFPGLAHLSISCGESLGMRSQEHKGPDVTSSR